MQNAITIPSFSPGLPDAGMSFCPAGMAVRIMERDLPGFSLDYLAPDKDHVRGQHQVLDYMAAQVRAATPEGVRAVRLYLSNGDRLRIDKDQKGNQALKTRVGVAQNAMLLAAHTAYGSKLFRTITIPHAAAHELRTDFRDVAERLGGVERAATALASTYFERARHSFEKLGLGELTQEQLEESVAKHMPNPNW